LLTVKVTVAAKIAAAPSMVIKIILVVTPFTAGHEGLREPATDGGDQAVHDLVPSGLASPEPVTVPPSTAPLPPFIEGDSFPMASKDACPELSEEDSLPASEIRLHIAINVMSRLNAMEEFRSLSVEELLLREFLLNQMLLLQDSLELCLVPCVVKELLGATLVAPPSSAEDIPSPPVVEGEVVEGSLLP
jgi:hypothetical protein